MSARDQAVALMTQLLDRFEPRAEWRHTEIADIVDAIIDAARAPESAHTRALAERVGKAEETFRESRERKGDPR